MGLDEAALLKLVADEEKGSLKQHRAYIPATFVPTSLLLQLLQLLRVLSILRLQHPLLEASAATRSLQPRQHRANQFPIDCR